MPGRAFRWGKDTGRQASNSRARYHGRLLEIEFDKDGASYQRWAPSVRAIIACAARCTRMAMILGLLPANRKLSRNGVVGSSGSEPIIPGQCSAARKLSIPVEYGEHWPRVPPVYLTAGLLACFSHVAFRIFSNLRLINDEAWFDSHSPGPEVRTPMRSTE